MRFWDSSAVVPLLVAEARTAAVGALAEKDPVMMVWWGTEVECVSAVSRLERHGDLTDEAARLALERLERLADGWHEIQAVESVRRAARRLLRVHPLTAADALQLAAALVGSEGDPRSLEMVTLDGRLRDAARREGLTLPDVEDG